MTILSVSLCGQLDALMLVLFTYLKEFRVPLIWPPTLFSLVYFCCCCSIF